MWCSSVDARIIICCLHPSRRQRRDWGARIIISTTATSNFQLSYSQIIIMCESARVYNMYISPPEQTSTFDWARRACKLFVSSRASLSALADICTHSRSGDISDCGGCRGTATMAQYSSKLELRFNQFRHANVFMRLNFTLCFFELKAFPL